MPTFASHSTSYKALKHALAPVKSAHKHSKESMLFHGQCHKSSWDDLVISVLSMVYFSFLMFFIGTPKDQCHIPCSEPYLFSLGDHRVVLAPPLPLEYLQDHGDTQGFPPHQGEAFVLYLCFLVLGKFYHCVLYQCVTFELEQLTVKSHE